MKNEYVTKVYRQRTSMVTSIPVDVRMRIALSVGDHIVWQVDEESEFVQISRVVARGSKNDRAKRNIGKQD